MQFYNTLYKIRTVWLRFARARIVLKKCLQTNVQPGIAMYELSVRPLLCFPLIRIAILFFFLFSFSSAQSQSYLYYI